MLDEKKRQNVISRLNRIEGQIKGIVKMVEEDRYCIDIINQTSAIAAALKSVENIVMENHLNTCVSDAMQKNDENEKQEKISEIMDAISRMRK